MSWNLEAAADQLGEIALLRDAPRDWLLAEARAVVEAALACPHNDAGEGDWCYLCWTNIKTGETYEDSHIYAEEQGYEGSAIDVTGMDPVWVLPRRVEHMEDNERTT